MEVKVSPNSVEIVINLINFLLLSKHINILHFTVGKSIERLNQLLSQLESVFILREVSESLVDKPQVHVSYWVVYVEIILYIHGVHEFPRVNVEEEPV